MESIRTISPGIPAVSIIILETLSTDIAISQWFPISCLPSPSSSLLPSFLSSCHCLNSFGLCNKLP